MDRPSPAISSSAVGSLAANYTIDRVTLRGGLSQARVLATPRSVAQYQIVLGEAGLLFHITPTISADAGVRAGYQDFNNAVRFNELTQLTVFGGLLVGPAPARFLDQPAAASA